MCQNECLRYLEQERRWIGSEELSNKLKIGRNSVTHNLKKLFEQGEIKERFNKKKWRTKEYKIK